MRRFLIFVCVFGFIGLLVAIAIPFLSSLWPSDKAHASLKRIDISGLERGAYFFFESEEIGYLANRILVIKNYDGKVYVYRVPIIRDAFKMPDLEWGRFGGICKDFGPDVVGSKIRKDGKLRCHDTDVGEWGLQEWLWSYDGRNLGKFTGRMYSPLHSMEGKYLVIGRDK